AREQELVKAIGAAELQLRGAIVALDRAHVVLDLGQQLAPLIAALRLPYQPLLQLQAQVAHALAAIARHLSRRRLHLPRWRLAGGHLAGHRRPIDRIALDAARLGLRPWPPAPALCLRICNRQAERRRAAERKRDEACGSPS